MTKNSFSRLLSLAEIAEREDQPGFGDCSAVTVNSADFLRLIAVAKAAKDFADAPTIDQAWHSWSKEEGQRFKEMLITLEALEQE